MDWHQVVIRPLVTEKGTRTSATLNAYPFQVHPEANKFEIKNAIERIYNVKVREVRTANRKGKPRRTRFKRGLTSHWKRAVVVLDPDYHIDLF
ncbi:MAG: 50S ribosomal protein L23 [Phycisphaerae bacterium]|nr:50S ribosomal protein L23 [Phycisphaerae bacterium]